MNEQIWQTIMEEALESAFRVSKGAVAGARLREIVAAVASRHGEKYPPTEEKFGDFLKRFTPLLIVLRRPGKDLLVAPANRPELFAAEVDDRRAFLREDVFDAFTRIRYGTSPLEPWYRRVDDAFCWLPEGEAEEGSLFVQVPSRTEAQEVEDRRAFTNLPQYDAIKEELLGILNTGAALWAFARAVKEKGLWREWHVFRLQAVVKRIRAWCDEKHVEWRDEWLEPAKTEDVHRYSVGDQLTETSQKAAFLKLVEKLTNEELKRIEVPLDVVLRLFQG